MRRPVDRFVAEQFSVNKGRKDGGNHERSKDIDCKISDDDLHHKERSGNGGVVSRRESGCNSTTYENAQILPSNLQDLSDLGSEGRRHLNDGAFAANGRAA